MGYATHECDNCGLIRPVYQMFQEQRWEETGKSGASVGVSGSKHGLRGRVSSGRTYSRNKKVWICDPPAACSDEDYFERMAEEEKKNEERIALEYFCEDIKNSFISKNINEILNKSIDELRKDKSLEADYIEFRNHIYSNDKQVNLLFKDASLSYVDFISIIYNSKNDLKLAKNPSKIFSVNNIINHDKVFKNLFKKNILTYVKLFFIIIFIPFLWIIIIPYYLLKYFWKKIRKKKVKHIVNDDISNMYDKLLTSTKLNLAENLINQSEKLYLENNEKIDEHKNNDLFIDMYKELFQEEFNPTKHKNVDNFVNKRIEYFDELIKINKTEDDSNINNHVDQNKILLSEFYNSERYFDISCYILSVGLAKSDGNYSTEEKNEILKKFSFNENEKKLINKIENVENIENIITKVLKISYKNHSNVLKNIINNLLYLSEVDGDVKESETQYIKNIANQLGLPQEVASKMEFSNEEKVKQKNLQIIPVHFDEIFDELY